EFVSLTNFQARHVSLKSEVCSSGNRLPTRSEVEKPKMGYSPHRKAGLLSHSLIMVRSTERPPMPTARLFGEAAILLAALILTCQISFHGWLLGGQGAALFFLVFPVLLWIALRFGLRGSICGSLVVACFAIHGTIQGMGPFAGENRNSSVVLLLTFVGAVSSMSLMLTADLAQRQRAEAALRSSEQQSRELFEKVEELNQDLERRVRERTAQLEVINRELEAFCYSVSHDLRAPLRSIRGFSEVLLERYATKLDERGQEFLRRSCESSHYMDELVDSLLKLSRVGRADLSPGAVDLSVLAGV